MTDYKNELEQILERFAKLYANTERKLSPPFATATQKLNYFNNHDYELYEATEAIEALLSQHSKKRELEVLTSLKKNPVVAVDIEGRRQMLEAPMLFISDVDDRIDKLTNGEGEHEKS